MRILNRMEADEVCSYILHLREKDVEDRLFLRWTVGYQDQMSFDDFKNGLRKVPAKSDKEVIDEAYKIISMMGGGDSHGNI